MLPGLMCFLCWVFGPHRAHTRNSFALALKIGILYDLTYFEGTDSGELKIGILHLVERSVEVSVFFPGRSGGWWVL